MTDKAKISDIYKIMRARGLVSTKAEFSVNWLAQSPDYFTSAYNEVSLIALVVLYIKLYRSPHHDLTTATFGLIEDFAAAKKPMNLRLRSDVEEMRP